MRALKASSLLEAIVASIIFLIVFAVAMQTLSLLVVRTDDPLIRTAAERSAERLIERAVEGVLPQMNTIETYDWGTVETRTERYGRYPDIELFVVTARTKEEELLFERRQLLVLPDE